MRSCITITIAVILMITSLSYGADYYVNAGSGSDSNPGTSPGSAWQSITNALSKVEGDAENPITIHIAEGTYDWNVGEFFPLVMEPFVNLKGENRETTIIDASETDSTVISFTDSINDVIIEGVTLTGGGHVLGNGGGISCFNASPTIRDCIISENVAKNGAGIYLEKSSPSISNCTIEKNIQCTTGAGIFLTSSNPTIINCIVSENVSGGYGAGIYCYSSTPAITSTEIKDNQNSSWGGGIYLDRSPAQINNCLIKSNKASNAGGIYAYYSNSVITDCNIIENTASSGGGIYFQYDPGATVTNCVINNNQAYDGGGFYCYALSTLVMSNCRLENNTATNAGGGFMLNAASFTMRNVLVAGNEAKYGGGIYFHNCSPTLSNFTIANNIGSVTGAAIDAYSTSVVTFIDSILWGATETEFITKAAESQIKITYSDVEGGFYGQGNKKEDPLFASGPLGDYYLSQTAAGQASTSICVDNGSDTAENNLLDALTTRTDNVTDSGQVDMGYHYGTELPQEDMIELGLSIDPVKSQYVSGDTLKFLLDLKMTTLSKTVDIYLLLLNMDTGSAYFALKWDKVPAPAIKSLALPSELTIKGAILFQISLPSSTPPITTPGNYVMAIAATKPGTLEFLSNIASAGFKFQ